MVRTIGANGGSVSDSARKSSKVIVETLQARIAPESFDASRNVVTLRWYTGATVLRGGFFVDPYELRFEMSDSAADLSRGDSGVPLLLDHDGSSVRQVIGRSVPGSIRIEGGEGFAEFVLSEREDVAGLVADVKAGILNNVSMGVLVSQRTIEERDNALDLHTATAWELREVSVVPMGADPNAQILSATSGAKRNETVFRAENDAHSGDQMDQGLIDAAKREAVTAEKARVAEIGGAAAALGIDAADGVVLACQADVDCDVAAAREKLWSRRVELDSAATVNAAHSGRVELKQDAQDATIAGVQDALIYNMLGGIQPVAPTREDPNPTPRRLELSDAGRAFVDLRLPDLFREVMEARGVRSNVRRMTDSEIAKLVTNPRYASEKLGMSSGDLPNLLSTSANKVLLIGYDAVAQEWKDVNGGFVTKKRVPDYKTQTAIRLSELADLDVVPEAGEYKAKTISEQAETYIAKKRGNNVALTREMIINDDLDGFSGLVLAQGRAAGATESALLVSLIEGSDTMSDGNVLFVAAHNNLRSSGGAPSKAEIAAMRVLHGAQTDTGGKRIEMPLVFGFFGNDTIDAADDLVQPIVQATLGQSLTARQRFKPIFEPRLAATVYYTVGPAMFSGVHYGYVAGNEGPQLETVDDPMHDALNHKMRLEFAVWLSDWRGIYKNAGA